MSFLKTCHLKFDRSKKCFLSFPNSWTSDTKEDDIFVVESVETEVKGYFSSSGVHHSGQDVSIDGMFATKIGFKHEENVIVKKITHSVSSCQRIWVDPVSTDDWEILHDNSSFIESFLMFQVKVVWPGLVFPIWVPGGANLCLFVRVHEMEPSTNDCLILQEMTEVIVGVGNDSNRTVTKTSRKSIDAKEKTGVLSKFNSVLSSWVGINNPSSITSSVSQNFQPHEEWFPSLPSTLMRRVVYGCDVGMDTTDCFNAVWIHPSDHPDRDGISSERILCRLKIILSPNDLEVQTNILKDSSSTGKKIDASNEKKYLETVVLLFSSKQCPVNHVVPCNSLVRQMGLKRYHRIILSKFSDPETPVVTDSGIKVGHKVPVAQEVKLVPKDAGQIDNESIYQDIVRLLELQEVSVVSSGTLIRVGNKDFIMESDSCYCLKKNVLSDISLEPPSIINYKTSWGLSLPMSKIPDEKLTSHKQKNFQSVFVEESESLRSLLFCYTRLTSLSQGLEPNSKTFKSICGCILLNGSKGSGRDTLLMNQIEMMKKSPYLIFVKTIDCKLLRGKRLDSFGKVMSRDLAEVFYKRPSVLVLQDLDYLLPSFSNEEENTVEAVHVLRMALIVIKLIRKFEQLSSSLSKGCQVAVVCTSRGEHLLHKCLFHYNFFTHSIEIPLPDKHQRLQLIKLFCQKSEESFILDKNNLELIASKTEGFSPGDLKKVVDQSWHLSLQDSSTTSSSINCFNNILATFTPMSLRGTNLVTKSNRVLNDVGGLSHVKKVLKETLLWPVKYPHLMSKCPIRPTSCLLLYGPPGTGKTLIAEAAANEVNINFISIEGPELLSKYIGASEQAVRDLFGRAKTAKPCIIFFDEFDSIAPRRGADSTGVTDRVVNQLLTQMDGVEGLDQGIFILAATSRPDLIDPALLRPGRFDKWLRCDLPDSRERIEIIKLLLKNISVENEKSLDWNMLCQMTSNFSGADLQSALFSAQVLAANRILCQSQEPGKDEDKDLEFIPHSDDRRREIECLLENLDLVEVQETIERPQETGHTSHARVVLTCQEVMDAIAATKPSVSDAERLKFAQIYSKFEKGLQATGPKRVTLA